MNKETIDRLLDAVCEKHGIEGDKLKHDVRKKFFSSLHSMDKCAQIISAQKCESQRLIGVR